MRILNRLLTCACKDREDRSSLTFIGLAPYGVVDGFFAEAADSVVLEICSGSSILRVLESANTSPIALAFASSTREEMA
jgi:hypothetical protein